MTYTPCVCDACTNLPSFSNRNILSPTQIDLIEIKHTSNQLTTVSVLTGRVCFVFRQQLEVSREQVEQCRPLLRKHVDSLVMDLRSRDALELVYRAEDHAQDLSKQAAGLHRSCMRMCVCVLSQCL